MSYAVVVRFVVEEDAMPAFLELMQGNAATSLAEEPGCNRFDVLTDPERPNEVFLYELYETRSAFDDHLASAHFRAFDHAVASMIARKSVECWSGVFP